jgi:hypothetical protein
MVFEWRVSTGRWRWLLLGCLTASACEHEAQKSTEQSPDVPTGHLAIGSVSPLHACVDPVPLGGGWERCANGVTHRAELGQCTSSLPRAPGSDPAVQQVLEVLAPKVTPDAGSADAGPPVQNEELRCRSDSDCTAQPYGHCEGGGLEVPPRFTYCDYGCVTDSDCAPRQVCLCGSGPVGRCVASPCRTDADCEGDGMCGSAAEGTCGSSPFACQTQQDRCASASDCAAGEGCTAQRPDSILGSWYCAQQICPVIGRPFLCAGQARVAAAEQRADWCAALPAAEGALDLATNETLRATIASGWLQQALMEHASVAAFARFSLQLLGLGAPAELVHAAARAQADEIVHAQDCFALARRYGAGDIGPGPLPLAAALAETDLRSIVLGTIAEGCIGETLAALEAAEACAHCTDPAARAVLERIADDETRHAQLAWRFVAWALETAHASLLVDVRAAFERELSSPAPAGPASDSDRGLMQHGLMTAALRSALRARVLREVIAPCVDALLTSASSSPHDAERSAPATAALV